MLGRYSTIIPIPGFLLLLETGSHFVALDILELNTYTRLASNSDPLSLPPTC